ncbi:hypothetical protein LPJ77_003787, partial [Coemansia sp. RSA 2523]
MVGKAITKYAFKKKNHWDEYLGTALWATRVRTHSRTGYSPFYMVHGREPRLADDPEPPAIPIEANNLTDKYNARLQEFDQLDKAQQAVEQQVAAAHRVEDQYRQLGDRQRFNTNDRVMIRTMKKTKLAPEFYGPAS